HVHSRHPRIGARPRPQEGPMTPRSLSLVLLVTSAACGSGRLVPSSEPEPAEPTPVAQPAPAVEPAPPPPVAPGAPSPQTGAAPAPAPAPPPAPAAPYAPYDAGPG